MGRLRQPPELKQVCVTNIARNIDKVWCTQDTLEYLGQGEFQHILGPFDYLSSHLIQALLNTLIQLDKLRSPHLDLLLNHQLRHLDLSRCRNFVNKDKVIHKVTVRCQKLMSLNLTGLGQVSVRALLSMISSMSHLRSVTLTRTKSDDRVVQTLAQYCRHLQELDVSYCSVSDNSMYSLCGWKDRTDTGCPRMTKLYVRNTSVSTSGLLCALQKLRHLIVLDHEHLLHVFLTLSEQPEQHQSLCGNRGMLCLNTFTVWMNQLCNVDQEEFEDALVCLCQLCPLLTTMDIEGELSGRTLAALTKLSHLRCLTLVNECDTEARDASHIISLLKAQGAHIEELALTNYIVDVLYIGRCCPRLRKVCISNHDHSVYRDENDQSPVFDFWSENRSVKGIFLQLKSMLLYCCNDNNAVATDSLSALLMNSMHLKKLELVSVAGLTDDILHKSIVNGHFMFVECLSITSCNNISIDPFLTLIKVDNSLRKLMLINCALISCRDSIRLQTCAKVNKVDAEIVWE